MSLIDRYVHAVTGRLPEASRRDVEQELRANIQDMLPEAHTEDDLRAVLLELGNPYRLAEEYRETKRYLIGPSVYDNYMHVLYLVIGIVVPVMLGLSLLGSIFDTSSVAGMVPNLVEIIWSALGAAIGGALQAALWVTVVFVLIERSGANAGELPFSHKQWTLDDLPQVPRVASRQIPRIEGILAAVGTLVGTAVFVSPGVIGWYERQGGRLVLVASIFDSAVMRSYLPGILLVGASGLLVAGLKLVYGRWNLLLAISNAVNNFLFAGMVFVLAGNPAVTNRDFIAKVESTLKVTAREVSNGRASLLWGFLAIVVVATLLDAGSGFYKYYQNTRA